MQASGAQKGDGAQGGSQATEGRSKEGAVIRAAAISQNKLIHCINVHFGEGSFGQKKQLRMRL